MSDFYVGYLPKAPAGLAHFVRRIVVITGGLCALIALLLVLAQAPFPRSTFEYQNYREYEGTLEPWPYPTLLTGDSRFLLVDPGKHGFSADANDFQGKSVRLKGALIRRGEDGKMLELLPGSLQPVGAAQTRSDAILDLGRVTATGEIVDSKCYFGVMNPGNGKVHRDCAVRCISGGIPPAFLVKDSSGAVRTILLVGSDGRQLSREVLNFIAEPVQISGSLVRSGPTLILKIEPKDFRRKE
jgi:hypothetical protein